MDLEQGSLVAIYTAPESGAPMQARDEVEAVAGRGLAGDRYGATTGKYSGSRLPDAQRAVTLIEAETLDAVRDECGVELGAHETRRNLLTRGVALNDLVGVTFRVGDA